jgi:hypothetical protein
MKDLYTVKMPSGILRAINMSRMKFPVMLDVPVCSE